MRFKNSTFCTHIQRISPSGHVLRPNPGLKAEMRLLPRQFATLAPTATYAGRMFQSRIFVPLGCDALPVDHKHQTVEYV
jgi:hypothetical protein